MWSVRGCGSNDDYSETVSRIGSRRVHDGPEGRVVYLTSLYREVQRRPSRERGRSGRINQDEVQREVSGSDADHQQQRAMR